MKQSQDVITIRTRRQGHHNVTKDVAAWLSRQEVDTGLLTVMIPHVRASLTIRENIDRDDLHAFFNALEGDEVVREHPPLHSTHLAIPVREGRMMLGMRQGVYVCEDRDEPQNRQIVLHLIGE